ncbi:hypothetical protein UFOVP147_14 [uncultured Caudovirales phage]|uniref:Uncharacterized protein n=1 Tax=uncultured Caudovirales phage TaxID=2100421 RepID=A0A6J7W8U5_9CAUD|nr:hypothetical protein UFOVP147_14 [uncultured Caudovirales phage]
MNCCNHNCNQGRDCPVRQACELPITMDEPPVTFARVIFWVRNALAGVGIAACIIGIGFWSAR